MKPKNEMVTMGRPTARDIHNCPPCTTTTYHNKKIASSGTDLTTRVCAYCDHCLPPDEDPCHFCGHLEPAERVNINDSMSSSIKIQYFFLISTFLFFGIYMILAPDANPIPGYECDLFETDECMLPFLIWSRPGGIALIVIAFIFIGWQAFSSSRR